MRLYPIALLGLSLSFSPSLSAADPLLPALHPDSAGAVEFDVQTVRERAGQAAGVSLFVDPQAAEWRAYLFEQWRLLQASEPEAPPVAAWVTGARRLLGVAEYPVEAASTSRRSMPPIAFAADLGLGAAATRTWLELAMASEEAATFAGISGWQPDSGEGFLGLGETTLLIGHIDQLTRLLAAPARVPGPLGRARLRLDGFTQRILAEIDQDPLAMATGEALLPGFATAVLQLSSELDIDSAGWVGSTTLDGLARPAWVGSLSADFARRAPADAEIVHAFAIDPSAILARARSLVDADRSVARGLNGLEAGLQASTGAGIDAWVQAFDGQFLMVASWGGVPLPIPRSGLVIGLRDPAVVQPALENLLPNLLGASSVAVEGALAAWSLPLPFGQLTVVLDNNALIAATDPGVLQHLRQGGEGSPVPVGAQSVLQLRLRAIASAWLPMLSAVTAGLREELGNDPVESLRMLLWADEGDDAAAKTVSGLLQGEDDWRERRYRSIFPGDVRAGLDASVAIYVAEDDINPTVLLATDRGWLVIVEEWGPVQPITTEALVARLAGHRLLRGKPYDQLQPITLPVRPVLDARIVPSLPALTAALPETWRIAVTWDAQRLRVQERGLPVTAAFAGIASLALPGIAADIDRSRAWREQARQEEQLRQAHAGRFAAMEAAARIISSAADSGTIPQQASELVALGLSLEDCAGFFNGVAPSSAEALNRLGRYDANQVEDGIWVIRLDAQWAMAAMLWGGVRVVPATDDLPAVPAP